MKGSRLGLRNGTVHTSMAGLKRLAMGLGLCMIAGGIVACAPVLAQSATGPLRPARTGRIGVNHRGAAIWRLPVGAIDAVVSLKPDQKAKITEIQEKLKADVKAEPDRTKHHAMQMKAADDITAVLTPEQTSKLKDQSVTLALLQSSHAIPLNALGTVKLTADQQDKIKAAAADATGKIKALPAADRKTKTPDILNDFKTTVDSVLTADQKEAITKAPAGKKAK